MSCFFRYLPTLDGCDFPSTHRGDLYMKKENFFGSGNGGPLELLLLRKSIAELWCYIDKKKSFYC